MDVKPVDGLKDDLEALAFFHYAVAALAGFFGILPVVYLGMAWVVGIDPFARSLHLAVDSSPPVALQVGAVVLALFCFACAAGIGVAGRYLVQRRRWRFCMAMAAVGCLFVPFGTMLGLWAMTVLTRPGTREAFASAP
ncbi:MAG TPA: hypothetical protein VLA75_01615 [Thermoanaerobaculia bacterium]|nr:hypothetical protein [Thermoanaerobaculia bacterium]